MRKNNQAVRTLVFESNKKSYLKINRDLPKLLPDVPLTLHSDFSLVTEEIKNYDWYRVIVFCADSSHTVSAIMGKIKAMRQHSEKNFKLVLFVSRLPKNPEVFGADLIVAKPNLNNLGGAITQLFNTYIAEAA